MKGIIYFAIVSIIGILVTGQLVSSDIVYEYETVYILGELWGVLSVLILLLIKHIKNNRL